jgi:hypothetical protein
MVHGQGAGCRVQGAGAGCRVQSVGCRVQGVVGFKVYKSKIVYRKFAISKKCLSIDSPALTVSNYTVNHRGSQKLTPMAGVPSGAGVPRLMPVGGRSDPPAGASGAMPPPPPPRVRVQG